MPAWKSFWASFKRSPGVAEPPAEQFGKLMSLPDPLMPRYFQLTTGWLPDRVEAVLADLASGALAAVQAKRLLARTVVDLYHGDGSGEAAEAEFDRVFREGAAPTEVAEVAIAAADLPMPLARLLATAGLVPSNKEGRRKIEQGGVRIGGEKVGDADLAVDVAAVDGRLIQVGKRAWARIVVS